MFLFDSDSDTSFSHYERVWLTERSRINVGEPEKNQKMITMKQNYHYLWMVHHELIWQLLDIFNKMDR